MHLGVMMGQRGPEMSANLSAFLYLVAGVLFILSLRGLSSPATSRQGNLLRHDRHGDRGRHDAREPSAGGWSRLGAGAPRHRHRWRHRRGDRAPRADDLDAGTGRRLPLAGRHGRGAGRRRRVLCAGGLRHRHARQYPSAEPGRNVARRRHRRADLHRLGDRVPETVGPHERRADHPAVPPRHQYRARRRAGGLHRRPGDVAAARSTSG